MRVNGTQMHQSSASPSFTFSNADREDLLIPNFWKGPTDTIIGIRVTNLDSKTYGDLLSKKIVSHTKTNVDNDWWTVRLKGKSISQEAYKVAFRRIG